MSITKGTPAGFHSVTPHLVVTGASAAIDFYKRAFGAEEVSRMAGPDGLLMHAEIRIGDSIVWLMDENLAWGQKGPKTLGGSPASLHMFVADTDKAFERAIKTGATVVQPPTDMFWGARHARVSDPFGHNWSFATQQREVGAGELAAAMKSMAGGQ